MSKQLCRKIWRATNSEARLVPALFRAACCCHHNATIGKEDDFDMANRPADSVQLSPELVFGNDFHRRDARPVAFEHAPRAFGERGGDAVAKDVAADRNRIARLVRIYRHHMKADLLVGGRPEVTAGMHFSRLRRPCEPSRIDKVSTW